MYCYRPVVPFRKGPELFSLFFLLVPKTLFTFAHKKSIQYFEINIIHFISFQVLKPGGMILFRDYGLYDHAMLRFSKGHKISENFYVRQDGTRAYYFTTGIYIYNTRNLISNFPQTGQISNFPQTRKISNFPLINMHEQTSNSQKNSKQC